jgi:hypothetical protein
MSYESGVLTSHGDFLDKFVAFVTSTDCDWEMINDTDNTACTAADLADIGTTANVTLGRVVYLRSRGLDLTKDIIYCFWEIKNTVAGYWNIGYKLCPTYSALLKKESQVNSSSPQYICMTDAASSPYWFIVNSQRAIFCVSSAAGVYRDSGYIGFYTPAIAESDQLPLPMYVGGSARDYTYLYTTAGRKAFFVPTSTLAIASPGSNGNHNGVFRLTTGAWLTISGASSDDTLFEPIATNVHFSLEITKAYGSSPMEKCIYPIRLHCKYSTHKGCYGELDGAYYVNGDGLTPEDILTINGVDYLVWNNINTTTAYDFCAIRLD